MKKLYTIVYFIMTVMCVTLLTKEVSAMDLSVKEANTTATLIHGDKSIDRRSEMLKKYLESKNSPMADAADHFVSEADRLGLDWKFVAAIAGNESYFGQLIPYNSYNAWGWAVYTGTNDGMHFQDWKDGVTIVSEGLKYDYIDRGFVTIEQIGHRYAADPAWSQKVQHFIDEIGSFNPEKQEVAMVLEKTSTTLSL